jgi:hypothetical protein
MKFFLSQRFFLLPAFLVLYATNTGYAQIGFQPYQAFNVGSWPETVCIKDVNNDGLNDVVMGTAFYFDEINDYKIFVWLQNSQGGLANPAIYAYPKTYPGLRAMDIADVNNDHLNDVIIGYGDSIGIFFQNTSGTLNPVRSYYSGTGVDCLRGGDLNHDNLTDIVVCHWNDNYIRVFYQALPGFSQKTYGKPNGGYDEVDIGDVNNDGLNDVVFMSGQGVSGIYVYTQNTSGNLDNYVTYLPPPSVFHSLNAIAIGDVNNDGLEDVAASMGGNSPSAWIALWFQDPVTHLLRTPPVQLTAYDIPEANEIDDVDCDGKNEIITLHGGWMEMTVYSQSGNGTFNPYQSFNISYASHYNPEGISIGDINSDGGKDVAIADYNYGLVLLYNNSKPQNYIVTDTIVIVDTLFSQIYYDTAWFTEVIRDTVAKYLVTQVNTYMSTKTTRDDRIQTDSIFIRQASFCSTLFHDTVSRYSYATNRVILASDTTLVSVSRDSVNFIRKLLVYPNPADAFITIDLPPPYDSPGTQVIVHNALGALVYRESWHESLNMRKVDTSTWPNAAYLVTIRSAQPAETKKIVINR